jgi:hypothetical protein
MAQKTADTSTSRRRRPSKKSPKLSPRLPLNADAALDATDPTAVYLRTEDGSVYSLDGRLLCCSVPRFVNDIVLGSCCFVCGARPGTTQFNDEHVVPDWLQRHAGLHRQKITLPNKTEYRYDQYKIPCCVACNSLLGRFVETPISEAIKGGLRGTTAFVKKHGMWPVFVWLALLYMKTHLKDQSLRMHRDTRKPEGRIGDIYEWESLHHIHCVVRAPYTRCGLEPSILGSVVVLPAAQHESVPQFDFGDNYSGATVMVRVNDVCLIAVLNDSGAALRYCYGDLKKITRPLAPLQLREVLARLAWVNINLSARPKFHTSLEYGRETMFATHPKQYRVRRFKQKDYGAFLYHGCCQNMALERDTSPEADAIRKKILAGRWTFLFDNRGRFLEWKFS